MEIVQSNMYYYERIKRVYCVYTRTVSTKDVPRRTKKSFNFVKRIKNAQGSSACTTLLCMHKSIVHVQECCACTRILCMCKNLVHAEESCASTRFSTFLTILVFLTFFRFCVDSPIWLGVYPDMFVYLLGVSWLHFICFNMFLDIFVCIELPIELRIVLPIVYAWAEAKRVLRSWAGPAWVVGLVQNAYWLGGWGS